MNAENHGILLAFLPAERLHEKAVNLPAVGGFVSHALDIGQGQPAPQRFIQAGELLLVLPRKVSDVKIVQMLEVIGGVNHLLRLVVDVDAAHGARAFCDLAYLS